MQTLLTTYLHINFMEPQDRAYLLYITVAGCVFNFVNISELPLPEDVAEKYRKLIEGGGSPDAEIEGNGSYI